MISTKIRCCAEIMMGSILVDIRMGRRFLYSGKANLTFTYAKAYYKGGGWYIISGYAHDGSDVKKVIDLINDLKSAGAVRKAHGYYLDENDEICGVYTTKDDPIAEPTPIEDFVF